MSFSIDKLTLFTVIHNWCIVLLYLNCCFRYLMFWPQHFDCFLKCFFRCPWKVGIHINILSNRFLHFVLLISNVSLTRHFWQNTFSCNDKSKMNGFNNVIIGFVSTRYLAEPIQTGKVNLNKISCAGWLVAWKVTVQFVKHF